MELFSSNIKRFQETETPKKLSYISVNRSPRKISGNGTFQSTPRKFLILQETKTPKKFLTFSQKKDFLIFWKTENPKKLFIVQEVETLKKLFISQEVTFRSRNIRKTHSEKMSYISGNGSF